MARREDKWLEMWDQAMRYLDEHHHNPSKYSEADSILNNWLKYNRKRRNAGLLPPELAEKFAILTTRMEKLRRTNQYATPECDKFIIPNRCRKR